MANLKYTDKLILEEVLDLKSGYTILETNRAFEYFFDDLDFLEKYKILSDESISKGSRIREFMKASTDSDFIKFLQEITKYLENINNSTEHANKINTIIENLSKVNHIEEITTIEDELDKLTRQAKSYFEENNLEGALNNIWKAFERVKTILHSDKQQGAEKLIEEICKNCNLDKEIINNEFKQLTKIGNEYNIRHSETKVKIILDNNIKKYLFNRAYCLVSLSVQTIRAINS